MTRKGFALFEIVIALGIIALAIGGSFYFKGLQGQKSTVEIGNDAIQKAKELQRQSEDQATREGNVVDLLSGVSSASFIKMAYTTGAGTNAPTVHIKFTDGTEFIAPKDTSAEGFEFAGTDVVKVATDTQSAGWENLYMTGGQSYAIPLSLSIFKNGKVITVISPGQMIWSWMFIDNGNQVGLIEGPTHGTDVGTYVLYDAKTGEDMQSVVGPLTGQAPSWAKQLDADKIKNSN